MLLRFPLAISAMPAMPFSEASSASVCASFHAYDANTHRSLPVRHRKRVSTLRPLNENSFQNLVPTGSFHFSRLATSICDPEGSRTQRRLLAPSLHSGYCGEKGRLRESIFSVAASE